MQRKFKPKVDPPKKEEPVYPYLAIQKALKHGSTAMFEDMKLFKSWTEGFVDDQDLLESFLENNNQKGNTEITITMLKDWLATIGWRKYDPYYANEDQK